jgi:hypothetical protein
MTSRIADITVENKAWTSTAAPLEARALPERFPVTQQHWSLSEVGLVTTVSGLLGLSVQTPIGDLRPLLVAAAAFFPVGVVHGIGVWFGGWWYDAGQP